MAERSGRKGKRTATELRREAERILRDTELLREIERLGKRSDEEKRRAVETLLNDLKWAGRSNRAIGAECRVSKDFVGDVREELTGARGPAEVQAERRGKKYTVNTSSLRKKKKLGGRPSGPVFDRKSFLVDFDNAITELGKQGKTALTITREDVRKLLPRQTNGKLLSVDAVTKRLREANVQEEFSRYVESRLQSKP